MDEALCTACAHGSSELSPEQRHVQGIEAVLPYEGPWAAALHRFKYQGELSIVGPLARPLRRAEAWSHVDAIVPIPLHWRRLWRRGFNQVELLLAAARLGRPVERLLVRTRGGVPQAELSARERLLAAAGAFAVPPRLRRRVVGRRLAVVDDVTTTGATLHAAIAALHSAGASTVTAVALMRTV